jgi:hypothetical protein
MAVLSTALMWLASVAGAFVLEIGVVRAVRVALLAHEPLSGEHTDSMVYERSLWTPGERDMLLVAGLLLASGLLTGAALQWQAWPFWPALLLWLGAAGWDLWTWERVAASVKFVSWRRGWQQSVRRVAVSELVEVHVVEKSRPLPSLPEAWQPGVAYLTLMLREDKAVKMPRTGSLFGGEAKVEDFANFIRLQMDVVADNRRRAAADKRSAARRALAEPLPPAHPATKIDPDALPHGGMH